MGNTGLTCFYPGRTKFGQATRARFTGTGTAVGKMEALGFDLRSETHLRILTEDIVKSSESVNKPTHLVLDWYTTLFLTYEY
jgi:hypothetical protein